MKVLRTMDELEAWRGSVGAVSLVPTMGSLHAGHLSLVGLAGAWCRARGPGACSLVSVFVNPEQFDEADDLARYPRDLARDAELCAQAGADAVWAPEVSDVYPPGGSLREPELPSFATSAGLEDAHRPGHFRGVWLVLERLFLMSGCASAVFGEKDWQQLQLARVLAGTLPDGPEIIPGPIARDPDGMAMSSRNVHLSEQERAIGLTLRRSLVAAGRAEDLEAAERAMRAEFERAGVEPDYAAVRDAETLLPREDHGGVGSFRALVAARVGVVRLLDNGPWPMAGDG